MSGIVINAKTVALMVLVEIVRRLRFVPKHHIVVARVVRSANKVGVADLRYQRISLEHFQKVAIFLIVPDVAALDVTSRSKPAGVYPVLPIVERRNGEIQTRTGEQRNDRPATHLGHGTSRSVD